MPRRTSLSERGRMGGGGCQAAEPDNDVAVASGGIIDEDNRSAPVQESVCAFPWKHR